MSCCASGGITREEVDQKEAAWQQAETQLGAAEEQLSRSS